jgi:16S rRNA processing protein RimM
MSEWDEMVLVGTVARPHGLRGQVVVNPETDFLEERFKPGATFWTRSESGNERLVVSIARFQNGRPVIGFAGYTTLEDVERLSGLELRIPEDTLQPLAEGAYYHHQLVGCDVETASGEPVGPVVKVDDSAGGRLLVVEGRTGEVLIPLAIDICVEIDVKARRIRVDPPEGLLDLNAAKARQGERNDSTIR